MQIVLGISRFTARPTSKKEQQWHACLIIAGANAWITRTGPVQLVSWTIRKCSRGCSTIGPIACIPVQPQAGCCSVHAQGDGKLLRMQGEKMHAGFRAAVVPALLTNTCTAPAALMTAALHASTLAGDVTSQATVSTPSSCSSCRLSSLNSICSNYIMIRSSVWYITDNSVDYAWWIMRSFIQSSDSGSWAETPTF